MSRSHRLMAVVLLGAVALFTPAVRAEPPVASSELPRKIYMNKRAFVLPAIVENADVATLQELRLFVKVGSSEWVLKTSTPPTQPSFKCSVSQDGEYWFDIVAVDKAGNPKNPDFSQTASMLIVVVDTQQPDVEVRTVPGSTEGMLVECTIRDANPDPVMTKLEYESPLKGWQAVESVPGKPGVFKLPTHLTLPFPVRVTAGDRAGNVTTRMVNLTQPTETTTSLAPVESQSEKLSLSIPPAPLPTGGPSLERAPTVPETRPETRAEEGIEQVAYSVPNHPREASLTGVAGPTRQIINHKHVALRYQIEQLGPSGLGKVEVWATRDQGLTWRFLADDPDRQSPVEVDLPEEGLTGLKLVVRNGIGFGGKPPVRGDQPDVNIEVDTTKPVAQLQEIQPIVGSESPTLLVVWAASDKNLGEEPIQLLFATNREGPWQPISPKMKNQGKYRWPVPSGLGAQLFVRLVVTDEAGNVSQVDSQPVTLDLTPPKVRVIGLENDARPSGAGIN